ncbi:MAG: phage tail protein, partial [Fusobacteriaceae bacterium]
AMAFRTAASSGIEFCSSPEAIRTWLGASASGGDATYVKKAGDTMTGTLTGKHITATGTGNDYHTGGFEVCGNGSSNTVFPTYGFHQPGLFAASIQARSGTDIRFYAQGAGAYTDITARGIYANGTFTSTASGITSGFGALNGSHTHFTSNAGSFHFNKDIRIQGNIYCGPSYNQLVWSTANLAFGTANGNMARGDHTHTAAQVGLGNVNNWKASSAIGANLVDEYATTNMVAQVRAELKSGIVYGGNSTARYGVSDFQFSNFSGVGGTGANGTQLKNPTNDWYHHATFNHANGSGFYVDLAMCFHSDTYAFRRVSSGVDNGWARIYTDKNKPTKADVGLGSVNNWGASTAVNSTSATTYATASAVKTAYDNANGRVSKAGDTMTGALKVSTATGLVTSAPTQLGLNVLSSTASMRVLGNTDNNAVDEPVIIASRKGLTVNPLDGLAVGHDYVKFQGKALATKDDVALGGGPIGSIFAYGGSTIPAGFLLCDGRTIARADYPELYDLIGDRIPDLRGEFIRGLDNGRGVDSGRTRGSAQGDAIRNITGAINGTTNSNYQFIGDSITTSGAFAQSGTGTKYGTPSDGGLKWGVSEITFNASRVITTANENRPRNVAYNYIIKSSNITPKALSITPATELNNKIETNYNNQKVLDKSILGTSNDGYIQDDTIKIVGNHYTDKVNGKGYLCIKSGSNINSSEFYTDYLLDKNTVLIFSGKQTTTINGVTNGTTGGILILKKYTEVRIVNHNDVTLGLGSANTTSDSGWCPAVNVNTITGFTETYLERVLQNDYCTEYAIKSNSRTISDNLISIFAR